ncbi:MAG: phosphoribosylformylglycinamidine synthase I [Candidatus Brocadiales bacterium]|nr:phosphoribosylformylglycinamidine synthase I [Candidatus Bathyanammoxibius sp.]
MSKVKALVLRAAGTNCDLETEHALKKAGAETQRVHINRILEKKDEILRDYHILVLPGGFTYGDDIAAGKILANLLRFHLEENVKEFVRDGKLILGICNGFQALVKGRLLPALDGGGAQEATLTFNDSNKFETRWTYLRACSGKSVYVEEGEVLYLPVAHAEGKFVTRDDETLERLKGSSQIIFKYVNEKGESAGYPCNPNGSVDCIAGVCDPTGRIMGMMPHPERYVEPAQHPHWQRVGLEKEPHGTQIFRNAVKYVRKNIL